MHKLVRALKVAAAAVTLCVAAARSAQPADGATVTAEFDLTATFGAVTMDPATYIAHIDVTTNIPFAGTNMIPYLQVGPTFNLPVPTYTTSNLGNTKQDPIPCVAATVPMSTASDYSCATLSRADLFPFNCSSPSRRVPTPFTLADLRARLAAVSDQPYFNGPTVVGGEIAMNATRMIGNGTGFARNGALHYHYDVSNGTINGVLYPLYCGECLFNTSACTATQRADARCSDSYTALRKAPIGGGRLHVAKIVPYVTFPSTTRMTYHFQYAVPQLASDCAQNGVTTTNIYDQTGTIIIGTRTNFALAFGYVYRSFTVPTDQRQYQVSIYSSSSLSSTTMFSVFYILPSQYTVTLTLCDNPAPIYLNSTWARLPYCYVVTYLNVGDTAVTVGPRILRNPDGSQYGDVSTVFLPNRQLGSTLLSILPGFDPATNNNRAFCPPTSAQCTFVFKFVTAPQLLSADGLAFQPPVNRALGQAGPFDMAFPPYSCRREDASNCNLLVPGSANNVSLYDTFQVTLIKSVYPDLNASYVFDSRLDLFMQDDILYPQMLDVACASEVVSQPAVANLCVTNAHSAASATRGNRVVAYFSTVNPMYWNNSLAREEIDPLSIVFTVRGSRPQSNGIDLVPFVIVIEASSNSVKWAAFQQTWVYAPRRWVSDGFAPSGMTVSPLVAALPGVDSLHVDYTKFFFFLVNHYNMQYTDMPDTLTIGANVRYRHVTQPGTSSLARAAFSSAAGGKQTPLARQLSEDAVESAADTTTDAVAIAYDVPEGTSVSSFQSRTIALSHMNLHLDDHPGHGGGGYHGSSSSACDGHTDSAQWGAVVAIMISFLFLGLCIVFAMNTNSRGRRSADKPDYDEDDVAASRSNAKDRQAFIHRNNNNNSSSFPPSMNPYRKSGIDGL